MVVPTDDQEGRDLVGLELCLGDGELGAALRRHMLFMGQRQPDPVDQHALFGPSGHHRRAFVASLRDVYAGRDNQRSLAQHAGATYDELDRQYAQFLQVSDNDLAFLKYQPHATKLALGHTAVTDRGLAHLKGLTKLELLTLEFTSVTDAGVKQLQQQLPACIISH